MMKKQYRILAAFLAFSSVAKAGWEWGTTDGGWSTPVPDDPLPKIKDFYPNDLTKAGYPVYEPKQKSTEGDLPRRLEWTLQGHFTMGYFENQVCAPSSYIRCVRIKGSGISNNADQQWGWRLYRKDSGAYLGTVDRNVVEEVQRDYNKISYNAERHRPESAYLAKLESDKAQAEYIAAACNSGAIYCTTMAAKGQKFTELFAAACSMFSGVCLNIVNEYKNKKQKEIDDIKRACAGTDQQCFDMVTQGKETEAREESAGEKTGGGPGYSEGGAPVTSGERPRHNIRPFMNGMGSIDDWYDSSCSACKMYESKRPEDY